MTLMQEPHGFSQSEPSGRWITYLYSYQIEGIKTKMKLFRFRLFLIELHEAQLFLLSSNRIPAAAVHVWTMALVKLDSPAKVFVVSVRMDSLGKTAKIVLDNVQYKVKLAKVNVMLAKSNH